VSVGVQRGTVFQGSAKPVALICAYVAGLAYSLFLAGATHNIPTIWTANAVAIAAMMVLSRRQAVGFLVAASLLHVILELLIGAPPRFVMIVGVLDTLQVVGTAALLRWMRVPVRVRDPRGLLMVIAVASALTAIGSILVNGLLALSGGRPFLLGWSEWTTSNVLGVAIILPVVLILIIAIGTVSVQTIRTALENPVRALKQE